MIYLLSDFHGGKDTRGLEAYLRCSTDDDLLLVLGDVGLNFGNTPENQKFTADFLSLDRNIAFLDGNHENFDYLSSLPQDKWCGGMVHRLTDRIVHLQRGNLYTIQGHSFFVMGGCKSTLKWQQNGPWYPQEVPDSREIAFAYETLRKCGSQVDYVLTHKYRPAHDAEEPEFQKLLDYIETNVSFRHWYAGHWHRTDFIDPRHTIVYDEPIPLLYINF